MEAGWAGRMSMMAVIATLAALGLLSPAAGGQTREPPEIGIPGRVDAPMRPITTQDLARVRDIDTLSVSPDGKAYVILVRQAFPEANLYRTAWYSGTMSGGPLRRIADGGEARLLTRPDGRAGGDIVGGAARWSPDSSTIAFAKQAGGEVQVWRARIDGAGEGQVSHNPGDVRDLAWSSDGRRILFSAEGSRAERAALSEARARRGHRLQEYGRTSFAIHGGENPIPLSPNPQVFAADASGAGERLATEAEQAEFRAGKDARYSLFGGGVELDTARISGAFRPAVRNRAGAAAWLAKVDPAQTGPLPFLQVRASASGRETDATACADRRCTAQFVVDFSWSSDGREVIFSALGGATGLDLAVHAWNPRSGRTRTIADLRDASLKSCSLVDHELVCLLAERLRPTHVVAIDVASGRKRVLADVNPEFDRLALGRIERIEWATPKVRGAGSAPASRGYILYPPHYDPKKTYPLFVAPYDATGFARGGAGDEQPLLVYAANGIVVLDTNFPLDMEAMATCAGSACTLRGYDPEEDYPHLSSFAAGTFAGIEAASRHANIDPRRVGIGGVSNGAFIPLHMLLTADRLTALSIGGGGWSQHEYYMSPMPEAWAEHPQATSLWPKDEDFWKPIDLSYHTDKIEAPILFHFADREFQGAVRLVRDIADARLPFEAYNFTGESHFKVKPAHRLAIYDRNVDWFRFWLKDEEVGDPQKAEQYARWRKLRGLQCRNPRGVRGDYCAALPQ